MPKKTQLAGFHKASGLLPDFYAQSVTAIRPQLLRELGVRHLVLDVDHTLAALNASELTPATASYLRKLQDEGVVDSIFIASNSRRDLRIIAESIRAQIIRPGRLLRKPSKAYYRKVLQTIDCQPNETMMVGDKLFNDSWGGNRVGMYTLLVEPIGQAQWLDRLLGRRYWGGRYLKRYGPKEDKEDMSATD